MFCGEYREKPFLCQKKTGYGMGFLKSLTTISALSSGKIDVNVFNRKIGELRETVDLRLDNVAKNLEAKLLSIGQTLFLLWKTG